VIFGLFVSEANEGSSELASDGADFFEEWCRKRAVSGGARGHPTRKKVVHD
jgi:hypothetical protein